MAERFEQYLAKEAVWMAEKYTKRYESLEENANLEHNEIPLHIH